MTFYVVIRFLIVMKLHFYVTLHIATTANDFRGFSDIERYALKTVRMQCSRQLALCLKNL